MTTPEAHEPLHAGHLPREIEEENEMYGFGEHENLRQRYEENGRGIVVGSPTRMAREDRDTRPYVVRDLSWELARYLNTEESFSANSANYHRTHEQRSKR